MIVRILAVATLAAAPSLALKRDFPVGSFDRIALAGSSDVTVAIGQDIGVRATGDAVALDRLDIHVENGPPFRRQ